MIAEQVARYPILLDELLDRQSLLNPPDFTRNIQHNYDRNICSVCHKMMKNS